MSFTDQNTCTCTQSCFLSDFKFACLNAMFFCSFSPLFAWTALQKLKTHPKTEKHSSLLLCTNSNNPRAKIHRNLLCIHVKLLYSAGIWKLSQCCLENILPKRTCTSVVHGWLWNVHTCTHAYTYIVRLKPSQPTNSVTCEAWHKFERVIKSS